MLPFKFKSAGKLLFEFCCCYDFSKISVNRPIYKMLPTFFVSFAILYINQDYIRVTGELAQILNFVYCLFFFNICTTYIFLN